MNNKQLVKEILKVTSPSKEYNIGVKGKKIIISEEDDVKDTKVWTTSQEKDLDRRFSEIRNEMNDKFNTLFDILARNGMK